MVSWKQKKSAQGYKQKSVWITPEALNALEKLKIVFQRESAGDIISMALEEHLQRCQQNEANALTGSKDGTPGLPTGHQEELYVPPVQYIKTDPVAEKTRITSSKYHDELVYFTARRIIEVGSKFNVTQLHRDMREAGIAAHGHPSALHYWLRQSKNKRDVNKMVIKLRKSLKAQKEKASC